MRFCLLTIRVDIDLAILGSDRREYETYAAAIRKEYQFVRDPEYQKGRSLVLRSFLDRPFIYHTKRFREELELAARSNLEWEIENASPPY